MSAKAEIRPNSSSTSSTLRADFPEMPATNSKFDLKSIDLGRLAVMLFDYLGTEKAAERRLLNKHRGSRPQTSKGQLDEKFSMGTAD